MAKAVRVNKKSKGQDTGDIFVSLGGSVIRLAIDVIVYLIIIALLIFCCRYLYNFCFRVFGSASVTDSGNAYSMSITVSQGETTMEVAERLEEYGLILDKYSFTVKARLDKASIKPGTFIISSDMDYDEIVGIITDFGQIVDEDELGESMKEEEKDTGNSQ